MRKNFVGQNCKHSFDWESEDALNIAAKYRTEVFLGFSIIPVEALFIEKKKNFNESIQYNLMFIKN